MTLNTVDPSATLINPAATSTMPATTSPTSSAVTVELDSTTVIPYSAPSLSTELQHQLDLYSKDVVELTLQHTFLNDKHPQRSALAELKHANGRDGKRKLAEKMLAQLRHDSEQAAHTLTALFRFVDIHKLWQGHPDPTVTSASQYIHTLDGHATIEASIVVAAQAMVQKQALVREIEQRWGKTWLATILQQIPDASWKLALCASRDKLKAIAHRAKDGVTLQDAITGWKTAVERRSNPGLRRQFNIRGSTEPVLMIADINSVRRPATATTIATAAGAANPPPEATTTTTTTSTSNSATTTGTTTTTQRKRTQNNQQQARSAKRPATAPGRDACEGPNLAKLLQSLIDTCKDAEHVDPPLPDRVRGCCDSCKVHATNAWRLMHERLAAHIKELKAVRRHCKSGLVVLAWPANAPFTGRLGGRLEDDTTEDEDSE